MQSCLADHFHAEPCIPGGGWKGRQFRSQLWKNQSCWKIIKLTSSSPSSSLARRFAPIRNFLTATCLPTFLLHAYIWGKVSILGSTLTKVRVTWPDRSLWQRSLHNGGGSWASNKHANWNQWLVSGKLGFAAYTDYLVNRSRSVKGSHCSCQPPRFVPAG